MRKIYFYTAFYLALLSLSGCSKSFLMPEKGGPDAYVIRTYSPLVTPSKKESSYMAKALPKPERIGTVTKFETKTKTATELLSLKVDNEAVEPSESYATFLENRNLTNPDIDLKSFDKDMEEEYVAQKERDLSPIDYLLGNDDKVLDPVVGYEEEESGVFSF
ncbi:MAG: hypothetical protein AAF621_08640 [Pseudomonadota bacterium]